MRRVFTHLTSGWQTGPFVHGGKRFSGRPGLSHFGRLQQPTKQQKFSPNEPGGRANVFSFYVIIITLTLRFRLRYVNVADVTFSFTLRSRSGRVARVKRIAFKDPGRHFPVPYYRETRRVAWTATGSYRWVASSLGKSKHTIR